ncbi:aspartyl-phosphate phosphatase Spo0E family protein [Halobacillus campisalis]|uniref:Spo0E family sporulation regulatory protein-aspartic acid phosphatase n=1 Tax=Halobacillus campisalis TaxID=435909 RepID=A0ABW2K5W8_9BACI|nr:aspartyl-phosphate phosphatase Spo0E family protein [Halobacillus campisalis]
MIAEANKPRRDRYLKTVSFLHYTSQLNQYSCGEEDIGLSCFEELENKIEKIRQRMYEIYTKNPTDTEVLKISQQLDDVLNELENCYCDKSK